MCRALSQGGRRCPTHTPAARRAKRASLKAMEGAGGTETNERGEPVSGPESDLEDAFARLEAAANYYERAGIVVEIGTSVYAKAVQDFGAPTTEEINAAIEKVTDEFQADVEALERDRRESYDKYDDITHRPGATLEERKEAYAEYVRARDLHVDKNNEWARRLQEVKEPLLDQRTQALKGALESLGVKLWTPETGPALQVENTAKAVKKHMETALQYVPVEWVEGSNERTKLLPLRIWESKRRAHYVDARRVRKKEMTTDAWVAQRDDDYESMSLGDKLRYSKERPAGLKGHEGRELGPNEWWYTALDISYEPRRGYTHRTVEGHDFWVRPKKGEYSSETVQRSEITIPPVWSPNATSTALHEFCHRSEVSVPRVGELGRAFLARRAKGEQATWLGEGYRRDEKGVRDSFSNKYMGKEYSGSYSEIVSMGMEELFTARGRFVGAATDDEYRDFIIGLLATSRNK